MLHTWGAALTHHPHVHGIVPGGGQSPDWCALDRLQTRILPAGAGALALVRGVCGAGATQRLHSLGSFAAALRVGGLRQAPVRWTRGCASVPVALHAPGRHLEPASGGHGRTWRDVSLERLPRDAMHKTMTLDVGEFMRRFLLHVLPTGFHRIWHYGIFANAGRKANLALARALLHVPAPPPPSRHKLPDRLRQRSPAGIVVRRWRSPPSSCRSTRFTRRNDTKVLRHEQLRIHNLFIRAAPITSAMADAGTRCHRIKKVRLQARDRGPALISRLLKATWVLSTPDRTPQSAPTKATAPFKSP